jgi:hypothetical protein
MLDYIQTPMDFTSPEGRRVMTVTLTAKVMTGRSNRADSEGFSELDHIL